MSSKDGDDYDGTRSSGDDNYRVDADTDSSCDWWTWYLLELIEV